MKWSPLHAVLLSLPTAAVYRLSRGDPRRGHSRGVGSLAAGSHQGEGIVQQWVHGLPGLLDGRLWGHVLRHQLRGQPGELPQIHWGWCLWFRRQVWVRLEEMESEGQSQRRSNQLQSPWRPSVWATLPLPEPQHLPLTLHTSACTHTTPAAQLLHSVWSEGHWSQVRQQSLVQELLSYNRNLVVCKHVMKSYREHISTQKKTNRLCLHLWLLCSFCSSVKLTTSAVTLNNYHLLEKHRKEAVNELSGYLHGNWTWVHHLNGIHVSASLQQYLRHAS